MSIYDYMEKLRKKMKCAEDELTDDDLLTALESSLNEMNRDIPLIKSKKYELNENAIYELPLDWIESYSFIQSIEHQNDGKLTVLDEEDFRIITEEGTAKIKIDLEEIEGLVTVYYSVPYQITEMIDNLSGAASNAVIWLAASHLALNLAQKSVFEKNALIGSEITVDNKSERFIKLGKEYKTKYEEIINRILFGSAANGSYLKTTIAKPESTGFNKLFH